VPSPSPLLAVVLDANVLFPASLRDLLLRCAEQRLYRLQISEQIWEEVARNLRTTGRLTEEQARRLHVEVQEFLLSYDFLVTDYEPLIPTLTNHPKDRHVLAVAIHARAQLILTFNLKDFPASVLLSHGVVAVHPDSFLTRLYDEQANVMRQIVRDQAAALKNPPLMASDVLDALAQHVPGFAARLRVLLGKDGS
jgi:predicted nucleic acid-binding protein